MITREWFKPYLGHRLIFIGRHDGQIAGIPEMIGRIIIDVSNPDALNWDRMRELGLTAFSFSIHHSEQLMRQMEANHGGGSKRINNLSKGN